MINNKLLKSAAGAGGITPSDNFAVSIWSGDGGTNRNIPTGFNLSSNGGLVWIKKRTGSGGSDHILQDSVVGVTNFRYANDPSQDIPNGGSTHNQLKTFDSDGFSVAQSAYTNASGSTYVAWSFLGGGSAVQNNDGTITGANCLVSANKPAGFSIIKYAAASGTLGHSLDQTPEIIFQKKTSGSEDWYVYFPPTIIDSNYNYMVLNSTAAKATTSSTAPTATTFNPVSTSGDYIAYAFHSVAGYSSIGKYDGTGTTSGNFVETGFEPAWLMIKCHTNSGTSWIIVDNKRNPSNPRRNRLTPNSNALEDGDYDQFEFFTTGFRANGTDTSLNGSGRSMIYLAFAADPDTTTPTLASSFSIHNYAGTGATRNILTSSLKTSGEIALYDFNTTTLTDDKTGNYSGGTNNNVTRNTSDKKFGDSSAEFNGSTADIDLEAGLDSSTMSVSFWIKIDSTITNSGVVIELENGYGVWFLASAAGKLGMQSSNGNSQHTLSNAQLSASTWHHVAAVWNSGSRTFYINNATQSGGTVADYLTCDENTLGSRRSGEFFDGRLDQVRFYNYALDATQVGYLYAETGNEVYRKPDFVWIKDRLANGEWNALTDSVRGKNSQLFSNEANAQDTKSTVVSDFIENGFTVVSDNLVNRAFTGSVGSYVAWCWKMLDNNNDNAELNEVGTIDSLVSLNSLAGQSITTYTGNGTQNATVGNGFNTQAKLVIIKNRDQGDAWFVGSPEFGTNGFVELNEFTPIVNNNAALNYTINSTTMQFTGTTPHHMFNASGERYVMYSFHNITGYQKIGKYTGDSPNAVTVSVGFTPDFVMLKDLTGNDNWIIFDTVRSPSNNRQAFLYADLAEAEGNNASVFIQINTNEFVTNTGTVGNRDGHEYLYWAIKIN